MRRDHAERAAVEHALDFGDARHAHERRDAGFERGDADLARGLERKARMLHIDIEAVEAGGLGDARDLDAAHEPHRHRGDDLAARELLLDVVAQDVRLICRHGAIRSAVTVAADVLARSDILQAKGRSSRELFDRVQVNPQRGVASKSGRPRLDLAACYRLVDAYGMTDLIYNHITARIPGTEHLLINLYGLLYKEITASSLVKIDVEGNIVWQARHRLRHQRFRLCHPRRHPQGAAGRRLRAAHPHPRRHGGLGDEMRAVAAVADLDPLRRPYRLSRL